MVRHPPHRFLTDQSGATAAVFGLSLFALVAIGGLGFDYARLAGMDSELQNAADQAALAGASQLDGRTGTCMRASAAATTLVANMTLLANDGGGNAVTIAAEPDCDAVGNIRFWQDKAKTQAATNDANANFIEVEIAARTANYAFTPLAGAISGNLGAMALAGLGSAICKVPPVMFCNPLEATDFNFNVGAYIGKGLRLVANDGGGNYAPGNFGYLETNAGNGAPGTAATLGKDSIPGDCVAADGVTTKTGVQVSVLNALNTRFDIYENAPGQPCGSDGSACSPSRNVRKDVTHKGSNNQCGFSPGGGGNGWKIPPNPYLPVTASALTEAEGLALSPMGHPRDMCHAVSNTGNCPNGRIGTGEWDFMAYFRSNSASYPSVPSTGDMISWFGSATPTRYAVYQYEMNNAATRLPSQDLGGGFTTHGSPYCSVNPGVVPTSTVPDRRVLTVAVINCGAEGVTGHTTNVHVQKWIDVFLVEPSLPRDRTESSDVYVEVIREATLGGGGGTTGNTVKRDVPYLIE